MELHGEAYRVVVGRCYDWSMIRGKAADMPGFWAI
jgi:hypothetical protein